ncbi:uncharacterized protein LOC123313515 [Coccinella septempunctata]|uniref:uncharacterized protein LOC123313515 n=1 Tax=Coccinella septempunctata TaxID=41139 RepID=UPI001D071E97|nr:uncharacterized protein LOC123313515 [Coccinella septempunctata]
MHQGCWKVDENDEGPTNTFYKREKHHHFSHELWTQLYKSKDTGTKAVYIDIEEDNQETDANHEYSKWNELPDLLLEEIFSYLSIREKYYASLVCRSWYRAFHLPRAWSEFVLEDNTLTRGRFNYYSGWQYVLDHVRTQMCLCAVGKNFRRLKIEPMMNFFNLYEFINMVSWYLENSENKAENIKKGIGSNIRSLKYTFPCNMISRDETKSFGTGGKQLAALKRLMNNLTRLTSLELIDLMLDPREAQYLLDEVCQNCYDKLEYLTVVNATKVQYPLLHIGVFINLKVLKISPQNLGEDSVELLGYTNLKHLHIIQNRYTPNDGSMKSVSQKVWKIASQNNPSLRVHLRLESMKAKPLIWQHGAPVQTVLYNSPHIGVDINQLVLAIELYKNTLTTYGHMNIPRFWSEKSFFHRIDASLMLLLRECPYIATLVVTERISTSTVLLLAFTGKNLRHLYIRGKAVIIRNDWPRNQEWTDEFCGWLKMNSRSYKLVEQEVSQILGYQWHFLTDKEFMNLKINFHNP